MTRFLAAKERVRETEESRPNLPRAIARTCREGDRGAALGCLLAGRGRAKRADRPPAGRTEPKEAKPRALSNAESITSCVWWASAVGLQYSLPAARTLEAGPRTPCRLLPTRGPGGD